jgi:hypothetical protein
MIREVVKESIDRTIPTSMLIIRILLPSQKLGVGYHLLKDKNVEGMRLAAAKVNLIQKLRWLPLCTPATPITQPATERANAAKNLLSLLSGRASQTVAARAIRVAPANTSPIAVRFMLAP